MNKWTGLCPWLSIALAVAVLTLWGLTWWSALLVVLLMVCPAIMLWGMFKFRRPTDKSGENK